MKRTCCLLLLLLMLIPVFVEAQEIKHYTKTDGLSHSHVYKLFQDSKGYLWIGTWDGLNRFDSHRIISYKHDPKDKTSINGVQVKEIKEDRNGNIWILTLRGVSKYNWETATFSSLEEHQHRMLFSNHQEIRTFEIDDYNRIWFLGDNWLYVLLSDRSEIKKIDISTISNGDIKMLFDDQKLVFVSSKGVYRFSINDSISIPDFKPKQALQSLPFSSGSEIENIDMVKMVGEDSILFCYNYTNLVLVDLWNAKWDFVFNKKNDPFHTCKAIDFIGLQKPGSVWLGSDGLGLQQLNLKKKVLKKEHPFVGWLEGESVSYVLEGAHKNHWIGTLNGFFKVPSNKTQLYINHYFIRGSGKNASQNKVVAIGEDSQPSTIWVGTIGGGLQRVDTKTGMIENIPPPQDISTHNAATFASCLYSSTPEDLLVGFGAGLWHYNPLSYEYKKIMELSKWGRTIFKDSKNRIWVADLDSVYVENKPVNDLEFRAIAHSEFIGRSQFISSIHEDEKGQIWFGTHSGLVKFNEEFPGNSTSFIPPGSEIDPLVLGIFQFNVDTIWLGTLRHGLYAFDIKKDSFILHLDSHSGLIDNQVYAIFKDNRKRLWASTQSGISCIVPGADAVINLSAPDELPFHEFNAGAFTQARDGKMYFGGINGTIGFYPDSILSEFIETPILIHDITIGKTTVPLAYPLYSGETLAFNYDQNSPALDIGCLDFDTHEDRKYRYRMKGYQEEWKIVYNPHRLLYFYNLPPGGYDLEIQSTNGRISWSENSYFLKMNISSPPFWKSKVFRYSVAIGLFLLLIIVLMHLQVVNVKRKLQIGALETEANLMSFKFLKSQMNPHFFFNTLSAINSYILESDIRSANRYLSLFSRLMRDMLDNSNEEFVRVEHEVQTLEKYTELQQVRFGGKFTYEILAAKEARNMKIPPMFVQPFIENAVEYAFADRTHECHIFVHFEKHANHLIVKVEDNGIGIDQSLSKKRAGGKKSMAIENIKHRISVLEKIYQSRIKLTIEKADINDQKFPGTRISLILPNFDKLVNSNK